jgi:hypothetical protein
MTKVIDISDEAEPLPKGYDFSSLEPVPEIDPAAPIFDAGPIARTRHLVGIAPKPTDPVVDLMVKTFLSRHDLRLDGFFPKSAPGSSFVTDPRKCSPGFRSVPP